MRGKADKTEIHGVQHQLNRHEDGDDVALDNERQHAQYKQNRAEREVIRKRHHQRATSWPLLSRCCRARSRALVALPWPPAISSSSLCSSGSSARGGGGT